MFRIVVAALALCVALWSQAEAQGKRVALIIGMGEYQHLSSLTNPVPDAKAIAAELKSHGFEVSENYNLTRADLLDVLEAFKRQATGAEVALVYYAGHGMEVEGKNVLAPVDMEIACENKTAVRSVALEQLFDAAGGAPQQIVLLDACRNNPFPQCPSRGANTGSGFRGFSRLTEEDRSLLIANATLSGKLAADGDAGDHSPFAKSLLKNFEAHPRLFLRDLLDLTAQEVRVASRGNQVPEITTQGGSPKICLDVAGCGEGGPSVAPEGALDDPAARADFYVRIFAGLFVTGRDDLVDFNCTSAQEQGICFLTDCHDNLLRFKEAALYRREHDKLAHRPFNRLLLPAQHS